MHEKSNGHLQNPNKYQTEQSALTLTYGAIAMVPVIGAFIQAALNVAYPGPQAIADRKWMEEVVQSLNNLKKQGNLDVQTLIGDVRFDRVVRRIAQDVRNEGEKEKREAYKSLIINYAQGRTFAESEEKRLLGYLERYSALHLQILTLMENPRRQVQNNDFGLPSSIPGMLRIAFPKISAYDLETVYTELMDDNLVLKMNYQTNISSHSTYDSRITDLGSKMLNIIKPSAEEKMSSPD